MHTQDTPVLQLHSMQIGLGFNAHRKLMVWSPLHESLCCYLRIGEVMLMSLVKSNGGTRENKVGVSMEPKTTARAKGWY